MSWVAIGISVVSVLVAIGSVAAAARSAGAAERSAGASERSAVVVERQLELQLEAMHPRLRFWLSYARRRGSQQPRGTVASVPGVYRGHTAPTAPSAACMPGPPQTLLPGLNLMAASGTDETFTFS